MKFGILATGHMAQSFTNALKLVPEAELYAVASRSLDKAIAFKEKNGFEKAYGSYLELVKDPNVEIAYIATPHTFHYELMKMCIEYNKPIICEKAFTLNSVQAKEIQQLAKEKKVFVAEALWPRYNPSRKIISEVINSNLVGKPRMLTANLSNTISNNPRIVDINVGGGALLDVGVYGLNFALSCFGDDIEKIDASCQYTDTGVDGQESITLHYKDGRMAVLTHGIYARSDRRCVIYCEEGYIEIDKINEPSSIDVYDINNQVIKHIDIPKLENRYIDEIIECINCVKQGKLETESIPLQYSVTLMEIMDKIRNIFGLKYPQE